MYYNDVFETLIEARYLQSASRCDITGLYRAALSEGWSRDESGAYLLKFFEENYSGSRNSFGDLTGYEAAVNGRGIPDIDLSSKGVRRARDLAKRGYAFARMALFDLQSMPSHPSMHAFISIGSADFDEGLWTGAVTFVAPHEGEAEYLSDFEQIVDSAILILGISDCTSPLPDIPRQID